MSLKFNHTALRLTFSRREVVGNYIFRLDRIRRNLMVSDALDPLRLVFITELKKIRSVSLKRIYRDIQHVPAEPPVLDEFLESIHFCFDFVDRSQPVYLPLYERNADKTSLLQVLEERAKNWYELISGLLHKRIGGARPSRLISPV